MTKKDPYCADGMMPEFENPCQSIDIAKKIHPLGYFS